MADTDYAEILAKQLAINIQSWKLLQRHGVTLGTPVRLDFSYDAPSREAADALCASIQKKTDYEVRVELVGAFLRRKWKVEGKTKETPISPDHLNTFVKWMVAAGKEQSCEFDGWGTEV